LPARAADALVWPILKAIYPSYRRLGLRKARSGPFRQIRDSGKIPLLDIGTVAAIRRGKIGVEGAVTAVLTDGVRFAEGHVRRFGAIVLATGYRPALPPGIGALVGGRPSRFGTGPVPGLPGLYFCGFRVSPTGMLREVGLEARRIVRMIAGSVRHTPT
jgi:hypothetical protein